MQKMIHKKKIILTFKKESKPVPVSPRNDHFDNRKQGVNAHTINTRGGVSRGSKMGPTNEQGVGFQ